ncbi:MAG: D-alanine--D-alanine ligase [Sedimenticolaceae bacterium]|jgi:D-alanine-D-alanine ligase
MSISAADFGKVAVVMGGFAAEREVSLISGKAVLEGLQSKGIDAHAIDLDRDVVSTLKQGGFDRVFNVVHGRGGEDGQLSGTLDLLKMPYTGSGVLGCALAMDKYRTKQIWQSLNLPTPNYLLIESKAQLADAAKLGFPLMLKAALEGSSIGVVKVSNEQALEAAWEEASACNSHVIAEQFVDGGGVEYTCSILGDRALPLIALHAKNDFYDYEAKYLADDTEYRVPCGLDEAKEAEIQALCLKAFKAVDAKGWGRVDVMLDQAANPWLIEVNTVPGMTSHSLVPMAAKAVGLSFADLVWEVLAQTLEVGHG